MMEEIWLTTAYFGPVEYFAMIAGAGRVWIEACENYEKQSYRNRCIILSANGPIVLSIPVIQGRSPGIPIRDIRIDHSKNWQKIHFKSIESAYRHSPYYEFLIDEFRVFWQKRYTYLFEMNLEITERILKVLKINKTLSLTGSFGKRGDYEKGDFRYCIHPKAKEKGTGFNPVPYYQVFSDRFGFVADLSILDYLFNMPASPSLKACPQPEGWG